MFAEKYGKKIVDWGVETGDFKFLKMEEVLNAFGARQKIDGLFTTAGKYGELGVLILADRKVLMNTPSHMVDTFKEILHDDEAIKQIKDGLVGVEIYSYRSKQYGRTCYSINFIDLPKEELPF